MNATALAARLDLDLDSTGICLACLSFVSMPLLSGDAQTAAREAVRIAPDLWAEGLEPPLRAALERARRRGDPEADEAIRELELSGARARIVAPVVQRLAVELSRRASAAIERDEPVWPVFGFTPWPPDDVYTKEVDV